MFPPLNFAAEVRFRGALFSRAGQVRGSGAGLDVQMANARFQSGQAMSKQVGAPIAAFIGSARPYLTTVLIVAVLLSVWIGLRAH